MIRIAKELLLFVGTAAVVVVASSLLIFHPGRAHAQGGVPLWTNHYSSGTGFSVPAAIATDTGGHVAVAGYSWNGTNYDYITIKYSNAGLPVWTNRYERRQGGDDYGNAVAVDSAGDVFVTGSSGTLKYSAAGVPLWTNLSAGPSRWMGAVTCL
jgi:hypothetical protein